MADTNTTDRIIAMTADVAIEAAAADSKSPPKFSVVAYTGGAMTLNGWDLPVVVDLTGMEPGKSLVANLDHDSSKRVGNVTAADIAESTLTLTGTASAATESRREVVESSAGGFVWQASIEARPEAIQEVESGKTVTVNGQTFTGPLYVAAKSTLKGFAFVSHGADDNTTVTIAATAGKKTKEKSKMTPTPEQKTWIEAMGFDVDELSADQVSGLLANYEGKPAKPAKKTTLADGIEARRVEAERVEAITEYALNACEKRPRDIDAIKLLAEDAIESKWGVDKFRLELLERGAPGAATIWAGSRGDDRLTNRVLEAAVCVTGRLEDVEKRFDDQTLQAAHDRFPHGISLNQLILLGAQSNGYRNDYGTQVTVEAQRAAFGMTAPNMIQAGGFSTLSIANVVSNVANKFLMRGWNSVDSTILRIAGIRAVRDFKTITTVSLTGDMQFKKVGPNGEIKHGAISDLTYTNKADTYASMLAITRTDYINDDLSALTSVPQRLGRGGALKLNDIGWTAFLDNSSFFASGNSNVNTGVANMTTGGLAATETIFMDQTDPDGKPLGVMPAILLVPTPLKSAAHGLMSSERLIDGTATGTQGDGNVWRGRFTVESSPYMSNSSYTGYSAAAWYMLANPAEMPVLEIVALNGRVEPVVETADADFNVLGVQMRGYSDVGVSKQEYRGGVRADGGAS